jgi:hypothetical protein
MKETTYKCPVCQGFLTSQIGNILHPEDLKFGVGLHCPHLTCPAQEVMGHGNNEKHAFEIVTDRFKNLV